MKDHNEMRALLPLAASGALAADQDAALKRHIASCPECARELEVLRLYTSALPEMPAPPFPAALAQRTQARLLQLVEHKVERRWNGLVIGSLSAFSWVSGEVLWMLARWITGGMWTVLGLNLVDGVTWMWISAIVIWMTAGAAALAMGRRAARERETL